MSGGREGAPAEIATMIHASMSVDFERVETLSLAPEGATMSEAEKARPWRYCPNTSCRGAHACLREPCQAGAVLEREAHE